MSVTAADISVLIEKELDELEDIRVVEHIQGLLTTPNRQMREWDDSPPGVSAYACWMVVAHTRSNTGIAYSEFGFGPKMPWGLLRLEGVDGMPMGMDNGWFGRFLDAYFESFDPIRTATP